jgi:hypothetical protein
MFNQKDNLLNSNDFLKNLIASHPKTKSKLESIDLKSKIPKEE